jgi:hypothetical protein
MLPEVEQGFFWWLGWEEAILGLRAVEEEHGKTAAKIT